MTEKQPVFHPILFCFYPVFFLFGVHGEFFGVEVMLRPTLILMSVVALLWLSAAKLMGDRVRAAVPVSLFTLLFFSFQAIWSSLAGGLGDMGTGSAVILICFVVVLATFGLFLKFRDRLAQISHVMNIVSMVLVCVPLSSAIGSHLLGPSLDELLPDRSAFDQGVYDTVDATGLPDIYYLLLDGYGRADFLEQEYGFDNSDFVDFLEQAGFYVADESMANYSQTLLAVSSALNFAYLDEVIGDRLAESSDRSVARDLLRHSRARRIFESAGYKTVSFSTIFYDAEMPDTDVYISRWSDPSLFEMSLLSMTPIPWALRMLGVPLLYDLHRDRTRYALEQLAETPKIEGPKFVYFHTFIGHPPFLYDEHSDPWSPPRPYAWVETERLMALPVVAREEYIAGYRNQVRALNKPLKAALTAILEQSKTPPIIILHGDHGPGSRLSQTSLEETDILERYSILNAYHLPGAATDDLYESISPVNSFRIVMNRYFGKHYPLLEDRSVFTPFRLPYAFEDVPKERQSGGSSEPPRASRP